MSATTRAWLQIHFCVFLWGFTPILGKLISLQALQLVWWRMCLVTACLLLVPSVWRGLRVLPRRLVFSYAGVGVIVALHWLTFYASIKLANASVAATCMALAPVFVALVEPFIARRKFAPREVITAIAVIPGIALVMGGLAPQLRVGLVVGIFSAFLVSIFGSLNKRLVTHAPPLVVTCLELGTGALFLTVLAPLLPHDGPAFPLPDLQDFALLGTLAVACTLVPFTLSLVALRHLSAFSSQLVVNLEPVYAILLAIPIFGEQRDLGWTFYVGASMVICVVFAQPLIDRLRRKPAPLAT